MSLNLRLVLAVTAALTLVACQRPAKPQTEIPPAPLITSFSASETNVAANAEVTLSWKTEHASQVRLDEATAGKVDGVGDDAFESSVTVTVTRSSVFVLTARGEAGTDSRIVSVTVAGGAPSFVFRALPEFIAGGEAATLVWSAPGAGSVSIVDGSGAAVGLGGQLETGSVIVKPSGSTTYAMTAAGQTLSARVHVTPKVLTFTSASPAVQPGETVALSWTAAGATKLTLSEAGRGVLKTLTAGAELESGTFVDTVPLTMPNGGVSEYTLTAEGDGAATSKPLNVFVGNGLAITSFVAPGAARATSQVNATWKTAAADGVEIYVDGALRFRSSSVTEVAAGNFSFAAPTADFTVSIVATNSRGGRATRSLQVDVVAAPSTPTLAANPTTVAAGQPVTLTFTAPDSRFTQLLDGDGTPVFSASGLAAEGGTATVYPAASTTYTIVSDNTVGDPVKTFTTSLVTVAGVRPSLSFTTPGTPVSGTGAVLTYSSDPAAVLYGVPHTNIVVGSDANFIDIQDTGTKFTFSGNDEAFTSFTPAFRTKLFGLPVDGSVSVSINGWLSFHSVSEPWASKIALPSTTAPALFVAAYWDDLKIGDDPTSGVYWKVVGDAPDRVLIVQWEGMRQQAQSVGSGSFQARIHEQGAVSFHYRDMDMPNSTAATVGVQGNSNIAGVSYPTRPTTNSALYFFSPIAGPISTRVFAGVEYGGALRVDGAYLRLAGPRATRVPDDVSISELNAEPLPAVPSGEWLEFENRSAFPVDLAGWRLVTPDAGSYLFDGGVVPAHGWLVVGATTDPALNDDAGVQVSWAGSLALPNRVGSVRLEAAPDAGYTLAYDAGVTAGYDAGVSFAVDYGLYLTTNNSTRRSLSCAATASYGNAGQKGTPGGPNNCGYAYSLQSIVPSYFDISSTGTGVFTPVGALGDVVKTISLPVSASAPAPLYFGQPQTNVTFSNNGFLTFFANTAPQPNNRVLPFQTNPPPTVAPYWDTLDTVPGLSPASDVYYKRIEANEDPRNPAPHWIFQWHHFTNKTPKDDDMNFQAKFFDDGVIEFHYARMGPGNFTQYTNGLSATVWIEDPSGTAAATIAANTPGAIQPFSAFRFVPR